MRTQTNGQQGRAAEFSAEERAQRSALATVRRVERAFADYPWRDRRVYLRARKRARACAMEVAGGSGDIAGSDSSALLIAAGELFGGTRTELVSSLPAAARLAARVEEEGGLPGIALAREILRSPELLTMVPAVAIHSQLAMLAVFAPLRSASVWALDDTEQISCLCHVGHGSPSRGAKDLAREIISGENPETDRTRRLLLGMPVGRWQQPLAALVATAHPGTRDAAAPFLVEAVPMLAAVLERDSLLAANAASERALVESSERKLTRLGFDLHDGPIQEVAILAEDLRLFRDQLEGVLASTPQRQVMRGRLEDLDAQLVALDSELRRISNEVHSASVLLNRPFGGALRDVARAFATRTNIEPRVTIEGDAGLLSVSQQIALLNVIHEALANIREHAQATAVRIAVSVNEQGVEAQVTDNGRGFDLEPTLMQSARRGHLGLVAMHERVRLLGGQCRIDSRPGGPTVISVALERWVPLAEPDQGTRASA